MFVFFSPSKQVLRFPSMAAAPAKVPSHDTKGKPLPKFGEWDVTNPASAEGFTMIFNIARDEKKTTKAAPVTMATPRMSDPVYKNEKYDPYPIRKRSKWLCFR